MFDWELSGTPTIAHLATIDGKPFVVHFYKEGSGAGELATALVPSQRQLKAMHSKLGFRQ